MPKCVRCRHRYHGPKPYCEPCEEYKKQSRDEEHQVVCLHCGALFMPASFDAHRWRVYYRDHEFPSGARRRQE